MVRKIRSGECTNPYPTILYGYGGFEIPLLPGYQAVIGSAWIEESNGCFVMANIRGMCSGVCMCRDVYVYVARFLMYAIATRIHV